MSEWKKIRKHISLEFEKIFKEYDLVLGPTTTCLPYELGTSLEDPTMILESAEDVDEKKDGDSESENTTNEKD